MTHCSPADTDWGLNKRSESAKYPDYHLQSREVEGGGGRVERAMPCWQLEPPNELIVMISIVLL